MARWQKGDPFSAFAIRMNGIFIGHVIAGYGDSPGVSEAAMIIHRNYQRQGYGTEAAKAMQVYLCTLAQEKREVGGASLREVVATAHPSNPSNGLISKFVSAPPELKQTSWGERLVYSYPLA